MKENATKHILIILRNSLSVIPGLKGLMTFSAKVTDGAKSVVDEQLIMADITAPKNIICAIGGVYLIMNSGRTYWESNSIID